MKVLLNFDFCFVCVCEPGVPAKEKLNDESEEIEEYFIGRRGCGRRECALCLRIHGARRLFVSAMRKLTACVGVAV